MAIPSTRTIDGSGMGSLSVKRVTLLVSPNTERRNRARVTVQPVVSFSKRSLWRLPRVWKRELDRAGGGLIDSAWFIEQLPASNLIVMAAYCPNVSILVVDYFDCDWRRHLVSLDHLP